jgi:proteasome assembly chaperone (PAC2) family protein
MADKGIHVKETPQLKNPLLIVGFEGWGNALNVASGMAAFLIGKLEAKPFAELNPDVFYRFDENRPIVNIVEGTIKNFTPPGGSFYAGETASDAHDLVILKADEPNLRWFQLADEMFSLCKGLGVKRVITLGSMYDNVLHSDRIVSCVASNADLLAKAGERNVNSISYQGPSSIHSVLQTEGVKIGFECLSLWCHCPFYLQGAVHFGLIAHLASLISFIGGFELDVSELQANWEKLNDQIQELIEKNSELQDMITKLRKEKVKGLTTSLKTSMGPQDKIIDLKDFLDPK